MNTRGQRILLWTAPPAMALFVLAYLAFPVFWPPLSPTMTPEEVAAFFHDNVTGILGVVILCNSIAATLVPLFASPPSRYPASPPRAALHLRVHHLRRCRPDGVHPGRLLLGVAAYSARS